MHDKPIEVNLAIEIKGESVIAHLLFTNASEERIYLDTWAIFANNSIRNDYFKIVNGKNKAVDYTGMMVKRMFRKEDFIEFNAGDQIETSIDIHSTYKLIRGKKYTVNYFTYHPASLEDGGLIELESNKVEFQY
jgi:predicted transcriptional regulator